MLIYLCRKEKGKKVVCLTGASYSTGAQRPAEEGIQKPVLASSPETKAPTKGKAKIFSKEPFLNLHIGMALVISSIKIRPDYLLVLHFPALRLSRQFSIHSQNTSQASWEKADTNQESPNESWNIKLIISGRPLLLWQVFTGSRA